MADDREEGVLVNNIPHEIDISAFWRPRRRHKYLRLRWTNCNRYAELLWAGSPLEEILYGVRRSLTSAESHPSNTVH